MTKPLYKTHEIRLSVPFHDVDPLQIVWHGHYMKYFDMARFALFDTAGIDLVAYFENHRILFPVTRTVTKHILPLRYKDTFICRATVTEARYKIAIAFEIRMAETQTLHTRGTSEQVAVNHPDMTLQFEIPKDIQNTLLTINDNGCAAD